MRALIVISFLSTLFYGCEKEFEITEHQVSRLADIDISPIFDLEKLQYKRSRNNLPTDTLTFLELESDTFFKTLSNTKSYEAIIKTLYDSKHKVLIKFNQRSYAPNQVNISLEDSLLSRKYQFIIDSTINDNIEYEQVHDTYSVYYKVDRQVGLKLVNIGNVIIFERI